MVAPPKPKTAATEIAETALRPGDQVVVNDVVLKKNRADLRVEDFRKVIRQQGYRLTWRKAILCTCVNQESHQATLDCSVCDTSGFFYIEPIEVQGIMTNLEKRKDLYRHLGEWLEGASMVTVEPEHRLGYRDSLQMTDSVMSFNEWIIKGNRRGTRSKLPEGQDSARYRIVRVMHLLHDVNGSPSAVTCGIHFEVTDDGWIKWIGPGEDLKEGTVFSINYEFRPVWIVTNNPHAVRDTITGFKKPAPVAQSLPVQAAVKLDFLIGGAETEFELPSTGVCRAKS